MLFEFVTNLLPREAYIIPTWAMAETSKTREDSIEEADICLDNESIGRASEITNRITFFFAHSKIAQYGGLHDTN